MTKPTTTIKRRTLLSSIASIGACGGVLRSGFGIGLAAIAHTARAQQGSVPSTGTQLVLLGTQGGPNFNTQRGECANALVVNGRIYMIDCGYGALIALHKLGLNYRAVGNVFLTHLHDDHTADVAALLSHQWTGGRIDPTSVVGPFGTVALVDAAIAFADANTTIRLIDEARSIKPQDIFSGRDIDATQKPTEIYSDELVRVSAVENTHYPEYAKQRMPHRSVSYRFDTAERSVAFSGDTAYSDGLIELAADADVLVCETMEIPAMRRAFEQMVADGAYADNPEGVWSHIAATHASTEDAGRMAAAAGVSTLVLTHLVPGALVEIEDAVYIDGAQRHFDGEIIVGRDLMVI